MPSKPPSISMAPPPSRPFPVLPFWPTPRPSRTPDDSSKPAPNSMTPCNPQTSTRRRPMRSRPGSARSARPFSSVTADSPTTPTAVYTSSSPATAWRRSPWHTIAPGNCSAASTASSPALPLRRQHQDHRRPLLRRRRQTQIHPGNLPRRFARREKLDVRHQLSRRPGPG